ncbi:hypothetical protein [Rhizobium sp. X9]|uniref:hypothetical protein n=1 Tax=Rhizobium sp. X9 TaxID=2815360 RepID=UPI001C0BE952|nr:hypothetical protein [Rhizobium sp. X9]
MNTLFASYVTGSAFRIDLSSRMVNTLVSASQGKAVDTGHYGAPGLVNRGLMEVIDPESKGAFQKLKLTEAGQKVSELCLMAGLKGGAA